MFISSSVPYTPIGLPCAIFSRVWSTYESPRMRRQNSVSPNCDTTPISTHTPNIASEVSNALRSRRIVSGTSRVQNVNRRDHGWRRER